MAKDTTRGSRIDLLIAVCALLISTLTAGAAIYQGRVISNQLSVTVWPYIAFKSTFGGSDVQLQVENVGAGPAIIRNSTLLIDGKTVPSMSTALGTLGYRSARDTSLTLSSLGPGEVIRAGDTSLIAHVHSVRFASLAGSLHRRVRVQICYCSVLGQCWLAKSDAESPVELKDCAALPRTSIAP
jgi:hypothetical protein